MGRATALAPVATLLPNIVRKSLKNFNPFSKLCEMGFFMKDKYRKPLDAEHPMRLALALSDVEPTFQKLVEAKWR